MRLKQYMFSVYGKEVYTGNTIEKMFRDRYIKVRDLREWLKGVQPLLKRNGGWEDITMYRMGYIEATKDLKELLLAELEEKQVKK